MNTPATNTAQACLLKWEQGDCKTIPVLEAALVRPNFSDPTRLDMRFADGSELIVQLGKCGIYLAWSKE